MIEIVQSNIFEVEADALVNPANRQVDLGWGSHVSELVVKNGGPSIQQNRTKLGAIELGESVVTGGGNLPFKHIIHSAVLDKYDFNPLFLLKLRQRTSDETLTKAMASALKCAADLGIGSVVFSPMGAGIGGMKTCKCAGIMVDGARLAREAGVISSDLRVLIAVLKQRDYDAFSDAANQP